MVWNQGQVIPEIKDKEKVSPTSFHVLSSYLGARPMTKEEKYKACCGGVMECVILNLVF